MAALKAREAYLTAEVVKLLKQNGELLEVEKRDKVERDTLKREFGQVQNALDNTRLRLVDLEGL